MTFGVLHGKPRLEGPPRRVPGDIGTRRSCRADERGGTGEDLAEVEVVSRRAAVRWSAGKLEDHHAAPGRSTRKNSRRAQAGSATFADAEGDGDDIVTRIRERERLGVAGEIADGRG